MAEVIARKRYALVVVDNTFATPVHQRPLELGADAVVHSTTKYLGGHSDVVGGAVIARDADLHEQVHFIQKSIGAVPGPFDSFLVHRGLRTLAVRMRAHAESARAVSEWLSSADGAYDVRWPFVGMAQRVTYAIGRNKKVLLAFHSELHMKAHASEACQAVAAESGHTA